MGDMKAVSAAAFLDPDLFGGDDAVRFHEVLSPGFTTPVYLVYRRENELLRPILKCLRAYFAAPQLKR